MEEKGVVKPEEMVVVYPVFKVVGDFGLKFTGRWVTDGGKEYCYADACSAGAVFNVPVERRRAMCQ